MSRILINFVFDIQGTLLIAKIVLRHTSSVIHITYFCVSGGKKCLFFGNFGVLCFLETPVLRFPLLPYYRRLTLFAYFPSLKTSVYLFYFIFGLWVFCKSCSALQELSNGIQHDQIWEKVFSTQWGPRFKIHHFCFSAVAEAVCAPIMATLIFFSS